MEHLLQSVCELLSPRAREKGLEIAWTSETAGAPVMADEGRLRQILFNLAGNAVKFTDTGGAILEARQSQDGEGHVWLRLSVRDTGPGVPDAEQARIFEEYARASGAGARLEGAGLGLAIVRRLAAAHGGSVGLLTPPEGGSEFWFEARFELVNRCQPRRTQRPLQGPVGADRLAVEHRAPGRRPADRDRRRPDGVRRGPAAQCRRPRRGAAGPGPVRRTARPSWCPAPRAW